jgi:hypothetical protein
MEESAVQPLTTNMKELILLIDKKNRLNSVRKNAQWRVRYYKSIYAQKKGKSLRLAKKYREMPLSDIQLTILKHESDVLKSRIRIRTFGKVFSKRVQAMIDNGTDWGNEWQFRPRLRYNAGNFIESVTYYVKDSPHYSFRKFLFHGLDLRRIAQEYEATLAVEKMLTTKD